MLDSIRQQEFQKCLQYLAVVRDALGLLYKLRKA